MQKQNNTIHSDSKSPNRPKPKKKSRPPPITKKITNLSKQQKETNQLKYNSPTTRSKEKQEQRSHENFIISTNFGIDISFDYNKSLNEHIFIQAKELYIKKILWKFDAEYVFKKSQSKNKKMFGTEMIFLLNHPLQLANKQEITTMTAKFIGTGEKHRVVYLSPIGIVIKIEQSNPNYYESSIQKEYKIQQHNPIGITPIFNITPNETTTKICDYTNSSNNDCVTCMQLYKPIIVQSFLTQLLTSEKNENEKIEAFSTFFVTLYANLMFQTITNVQNSILPGNWSLTNLCLCDSGLVAIDFEHFHIITDEMTKSQQTQIMNKSFQHFFKQILDFCQTSKFHDQEMKTIIITLEKWNEDMYRNFENGTLETTWKAPMFTKTLLDLIGQTFQIKLFFPQKEKVNLKWEKMKIQYNTPNIHFFIPESL